MVTQAPGFVSDEMSGSPPPLTADQLSDMLGLTKVADSVELKASVPDSLQRPALGLDPLITQIRPVYFFDTPDLRLDECGVIVRARRTAGRADDTVVKLRPAEPLISSQTWPAPPPERGS